MPHSGTPQLFINHYSLFICIKNTASKTLTVFFMLLAVAAATHHGDSAQRHHSSGQSGHISHQLSGVARLRHVLQIGRAHV